MSDEKSFTALDLKVFLESLTEDHLRLPVYFDTEKKKFNHYLAKIGFAWHHIDPGLSCIVLNEDRDYEEIGD